MSNKEAFSHLKKKKRIRQNGSHTKPKEETKWTQSQKPKKKQSQSENPANSAALREPEKSDRKVLDHHSDYGR